MGGGRRFERGTRRAAILPRTTCFYSDKEGPKRVLLRRLKQIVISFLSFKPRQLNKNVPIESPSLSTHDRMDDADWDLGSDLTELSSSEDDYTPARPQRAAKAKCQDNEYRVCLSSLESHITH